MDKAELLEKIRTLGIWKRREQRAPHKPLLILLMLGRLQSNHPRMALFADIEGKLTNLLEEFGPSRKSYHPEEPFCRLQTDGFWELSIELPTGSLSKTTLRQQKVKGGFTEATDQILKTDPSIVNKIVNHLLQEHFQTTLHEDILNETGLNIEANSSALNTEGQRRVRDPQFRQRILQAYDFRCAICNFDVRLGQKIIALEAAHIKWFNHGGPDIVHNGVALCSLHHKLLDSGAIGILSEHRVIVSEKVSGYAGLNEWILNFEGNPINSPRKIEYAIKTEFTNWHIKEVFKSIRN